MDKKQLIVEKRRLTILNKRLRKSLIISQNKVKQLLKAGGAYSEEKGKISDKFKVVPVKEHERERKKYEQKIIKDDVNGAINGMFQMRTLDDIDLLNDHYYLKGVEFFKLNSVNIKRELIKIFTKEITQNNKNLKITQYITIKYLVEINGELLDRWFSSDSQVLKSVKSLDVMVGELLREFEAFVEIMNTVGSGPFRGITKIDVKLNKSKNIYGSSFIELPLEIKNKKACININNQLSCKNGVTLYDNKCFLWSLCIKTL